MDSFASFTLSLKAAWICRTSWWAEGLGDALRNQVAHSWLVHTDFSMSQRIQESCQSGTKWLVETQVKARRRKRGAQKGSSPPACSLSQRSTRLSVAAPAHSTLDPWEKEYPLLPTAFTGVCLSISLPLCSPDTAGLFGPRQPPRQLLLITQPMCGRDGLVPTAHATCLLPCCCAYGSKEMAPAFSGTREGFLEAEASYSAHRSLSRRGASAYPDV